MGFTDEQVRQAQLLQHVAAHDENETVRLVAGPGTGKSFAVEERVRWLLRSQRVEPERIFVVSFTRAASRDLADRVRRRCEAANVPEAARVSVSTLHSLALRALKLGGQLQYPALPLVMDDWELHQIFDTEFSVSTGYGSRHSTRGFSPSRCRDIRTDYEAFCSTGRWIPPNYIEPEPPISSAERREYQGFHNRRTLLYSCVLPGEIIRQCNKLMDAGVLSPANLLEMEHLIVDEYQDLNPTDLEFVDRLIDHGVTVFVCGDDDQSIYSFRYASPQGIQTFTQRYPATGEHQLEHCFRCTPTVLHSAQTLLNTFSDQARIPKTLASLYSESEPPETGIVLRWRFDSATAEARAIASSVQGLIRSGVSPRDIMILVSNTRRQLSTLLRAFEQEDGVECESPRAARFIETNTGRFAHALLRIVCNDEDYVAYRTILGLLPRVGRVTCNSIAETTHKYNLNYRDLFQLSLPTGVFAGRDHNALVRARSVISRLANWEPDDTLGQRTAEIGDVLENLYNPTCAQDWRDEVQLLPTDTTLCEFRDYLWADTDDQRDALVSSIFERLQLAMPNDGIDSGRVRLMTMHGAKGLSANIVFIPGLEEQILPGERRARYAGLVYESARMLYVSITRSKAACIISYSQTRVVFGRHENQTASRFASHLGGPFVRATNGLTGADLERVLTAVTNMNS